MDYINIIFRFKKIDYIIFIHIFSFFPLDLTKYFIYLLYINTKQEKVIKLNAYQ